MRFLNSFELIDLKLKKGYNLAFSIQSYISYGTEGSEVKPGIYGMGVNFFFKNKNAE